MSIIFHSDIERIDGNTVPKQIETIYQYIVYMKEALEFWARLREKRIDQNTETIDRIVAKVGDTFRLNPTPLNGFVTAHGTAVCLTIPVGIEMTEVSGISITSIKGGLRLPSGGYLYYRHGGTSTETRDEQPLPYDRFLSRSINGSNVELVLWCDDAWTNANDEDINNFPVGGRIEIDGVFV